MKRRSKSRRRTRGLASVVLWLNIGAFFLLGGWYVLQPPERKTEVARLVQNAFARDKQVSPLDVVWDVWQLYYASGNSVSVEVAGERTFILGGMPRTTSFPHGTVRLLVNRGYIVGFSETLQTPVWAAYRIEDLDRVRPAPPRPDRFEVDRRTLARVTPDMYSNTQYDRGHLAPNLAIATRFGEEAQRETFLMSNIVPQRHELNAGLWRELESRIATSYPARYHEVWVVCGPVFGNRPQRLPRGVAIPESFYMIIVDETEGRLRTLAYLFPQAIPSGARVADYGTSIDQIELLTGLDFFSELEDTAEDALEAMKTGRPW